MCTIFGEGSWLSYVSHLNRRHIPVALLDNTDVELRSAVDGGRAISPILVFAHPPVFRANPDGGTVLWWVGWTLGTCSTVGKQSTTYVIDVALQKVVGYRAIEECFGCDITRTALQILTEGFLDQFTSI